MKTVAALLVVMAFAAADYTDLPTDESFYQDMLGNSEAIKNLLGCLLDINPCDEFGTHAKGHMIDSISNSCKNCGPMQKHFTRLFEEVVKAEEYKEYYDKLLAKYDPTGTYLPKLEESVAGY